MHYEEILSRIRVCCEDAFGTSLVGIYVHGSIAFSCFDPRVSDIDFLVVLDEPPTVAQKKQLLQVLLDLTPHCPQKGLEMSVVLARYCRPFIYPTPYEFHFSNAHLARAKRDPEEYCTNFYGTDKDLAAHFTVTRAVGQTLCGKPIDEVFGEVPRECYLDSIRYDVENAAEDITENPVYIILNLCRVAAYLRDGAILSKKSGGEWGLMQLPPRYHAILRAALSAYTMGDTYPHAPMTEQQLANEMLAEIFR